MKCEKMRYKHQNKHQNKALTLTSLCEKYSPSPFVRG